MKVLTENNENHYIIGNGSNLLVSDKGYRGTIIKLGQKMGAIKIIDDQIEASAGALLSQISSAACDQSLKGMEFASGIPGSLGGAIVMNAGAYGGEMKQIIKSVRVLTDHGNTETIDSEQMEFGYRTSLIKKHPYIVISAMLQLIKGDREDIKAKMEGLKAQRIEKQPLEYPSAGSTFKRPEGYFAGKLIMDAGLRGYTVGGAAVSEKHCGFVINHGEATASDVYTVINHVRSEVKRQFGVVLEPEVCMLGEFE